MAIQIDGVGRHGQHNCVDGVFAIQSSVTTMKEVRGTNVGGKPYVSENVLTKVRLYVYVKFGVLICSLTVSFSIFWKYRGHYSFYNKDVPSIT